MFSSIKAAFGAQQAPKEQAPREVPSREMSLTDFFTESDISANIVSEAKNLHAQLNVKVMEEFLAVVREKYPQLDLGLPARNIRRMNVQRLPTQIRTHKAKIRAWEKMYADAEAVIEIDRTMNDMEVQLTLRARSERAGLIAKSSDVNPMAPKPRKRKRMVPVASDDDDGDDDGDEAEFMRRLNALDDAPVQRPLSAPRVGGLMKAAVGASLIHRVSGLRVEYGYDMLPLMLFMAFTIGCLTIMVTSRVLLTLRNSEEESDEEGEPCYKCGRLTEQDLEWCEGLQAFFCCDCSPKNNCDNADCGLCNLKSEKEEEKMTCSECFEPCSEDTLVFCWNCDVDMCQQCYTEIDGRPYCPQKELCWPSDEEEPALELAAETAPTSTLPQLGVPLLKATVVASLIPGAAAAPAAPATARQSPARRRGAPVGERILKFTLKKVYFDPTVSGKKIVEERKDSPFYRSRFLVDPKGSKGQDNIREYDFIDYYNSHIFDKGKPWCRVKWGGCEFDPIGQWAIFNGDVVSFNGIAC